MPSSAYGGTEMHTLDIAEHFKKCGCSVTIAFPIQLPTAAFYTGCAEKNLQTLDLDIAPNRQPAGAEEFVTQERVLRHYLGTEAGGRHTHVIIASPSPKTALGLLSAADGSTAKFICIFHFPSMNLSTTITERKLLYSSAKNVRFVCISEHTRREVARAFKLDASIFSVIPNGTDLNVRENSARSLSKELGRSGPFVVTVGRLHRQKGYDILLEAIPAVLERFPNAHFVWCGDGPELDQLKRRVASLDIVPSVSFVGHVPDPQTYLAQSELVVLPTRGEGLSLTLLQSMALGCAIVTTNAAMQDEILAEGSSGIIVPVNDVGGLSQGIIKALADPSASKDMGKAARALSATYDIKRMREAYIGLLDACAPLKIQSNNVDYQIDNPSVETLEVCLSALDIASSDSKNGQPLIEWLTKFGSDAAPGDLSKVLTVSVNFVGNEHFVDQWLDLISRFLRGRHGVRRHIILDVCASPSLIENIVGGSQRITRILTEQFEVSRDPEIGNTLAEIHRLLGRPDIATEYASHHAKFSLTPRPSSKHRVAFVAPYFSYPPRNGSHNRMLQMIKGYLELGCEVEVFASPMPSGAGLDAENISAFRQKFGADIWLHRLSEASSVGLKRYQAELKSGDPGYFDTYDNDIAADFRRFVDYFQPHTIHLNYVYFGWLANVADRERTKIVVDTHDLISRRSALFAQLKLICGKLPNESNEVDERVFELSRFRASAGRALERESRHCESFDHIICISSYEDALLEGAGCRTPRSVVPFVPPFNSSHVQDNGRTCLFVGSRNPLNIIGLSALERHIAPRLKALIPEARFQVAGDVGLAAGTNAPLEILGFQEDLGEVYKNNSFTVCPLPLGTGQNIKISESLSFGRPVVAFAGVAETSGVKHMVNGLIATSLEEFYHQVRLLMQDDDARMELGRATLDWARENLDGSKLRNDMERIVF
ncbi:glycosyltransferase family 4 protein [Rhizobium halophytocola]|uniref:glycosyltransferase family 4 protein n=1 Tax=Rhizobium halophytocola TaxID=735519 RepID=UPI003619CA87